MGQVSVSLLRYFPSGLPGPNLKEDWKKMLPLEEETRQGPGANLLARFQGLNLPRWISYPAIQVVTQGLVHGLGLRSARSAGFNTAAACA
jgi:hypothetical protein